MPIHVPALGRRQFLGVCSSAAAGLWAGVSLEAQEQTNRTGGDGLIEFALLSDTHVPENEKIVRPPVNMTENFRQVAAQVLHLPSKPARVLINGDCAYLRGLKQDYAALVKLLQPLVEGGLPLSLVLGNHDDRENLATGLASIVQSSSPLPSRRVGIVATPHANWFLLDSLGVTNQTPGLLDEAQRNWLSRSLDAHANKPAVIMVHHNLSGVDRLMKEATTILPPAANRLPVPGLRDTSAVLDILAAKPNVTAFICGHTHQWNVLRWKGVYLVNLPPTAYPFTPEDPNGWVRCWMNAKELTFELVTLDPKHRFNGQKLAIPWRVGARRKKVPS